MAVERAARGHAGFYTCQAVGPSAQELQLSVKLNIETIGAFIPYFVLRCLAELLCRNLWIVVLVCGSVLV